MLRNILVLCYLIVSDIASCFAIAISEFLRRKSIFLLRKYAEVFEVDPEVDCAEGLLGLVVDGELVGFDVRVVLIFCS
ncbi:hypothetical protein VNO77_00653 [Canavalia gladiata]|uniref:Uncharacterized protein n=1 Tax=Canavalia gladiata TaxID=3824 RepID=A0AAN9R1I6_CANGL